MKVFLNRLIIFIPLLLCSCILKDNQAYRSYQPKPYIKPIAKVEKVWTAQHKYDPERRLVIPMIGGSRWGAVHEYKEDGTLVYREWWERDIKKEDLENTSVSKSTTVNDLSTQQDMVEIEVNEQIEPNIEPVSENISNTDSSVDSPFGQPPADIQTPSELPMAPLPFDSLPVESDNSSAPEDLPFAPLPEGLPPL